MKHFTIAVSPMIVLAAVSLTAAAEKPEVVDVWSGKPPGEVGTIPAEVSRQQKLGQKTLKIVTNVSKPTLTIYRPAKDKDSGAAVLICPGGGYHLLVWEVEGEEVAAWLNSIGVTGIILKYRVPRRPGQIKDKPPISPLQDAQRAISLVRSKAKEWHIDPKKIGILGFSAGGHLALAAAAHSDKRAYEASDDIDKIGCRPDFAAAIYPGYLVEKDKNTFNPNVRFDKKCPPLFLVHAADDTVSEPEGSVLASLALKRAGVPVELHLYAEGGHGFGVKPSDKPCSKWPKSCEAWLRSQGMLPRAKAASVSKACRSVHLFYTGEEGTAFYNEVTVDKSAPGTYFMVCGWNRGY
ncbi:MAG: alpha/beta hydrolase fold domain-containing protein, partial [Gemmataceae bacterium]